MKVVLIHLGISNRGFNSFERDNYINHGIGSLAAYLLKKGHKVKIIDLRRLKDWDDFEREVRKEKAEVWGISSMTVDFDHAKKAARIIKKIDSKNITVIGGVHATLLPWDGIKWKYFDYVVKGEGEIVMTKLLEDIKAKRKVKKLIQGVPCPVEEIPNIDRDLYHFTEGEMQSPITADLPKPFATIMTSRGCPFNCAFCQPAERMLSGGVVRIRPNKDVIKELVMLKKKYAIKSFLIHDDLFALSEDRIVEFARLYKKAGIKAKFMCQARADLIVRYQKGFKELKKAGLMAVMVGFESGSQRILDLVGKNTKVEQNVESAKICRKLGIKVWANYMLGIPSETYLDMIKTLWMILKMNPEYHSPAFFTPTPETRLYKYCVENKLLISKKYSACRRSIQGSKIKGFNYDVMRFLLYVMMPWNAKVEYARNVVRYIWERRFIKKVVLPA